jgi:hypothetical protein
MQLEAVGRLTASGMKEIKKSYTSDRKDSTQRHSECDAASYPKLLLERTACCTSRERYLHDHRRVPTFEIR